MNILPFAALAAAAASSIFAVMAKRRPQSPGTKDQAKDMLPISRVVMYQSGIGYVERCAKITGDKLILRIRRDQINDILKSLTIIDRGNGRPVSISLPVDKDTLNSLAQIPEQIRDGGIRALLDAFRGANVKIRTGCHLYEGRIVGVDEGSEEDSSAANTVTLLASNNVLHVIRLMEIRSVALYDQSLTDGLDKSLNISLSEGSWKQIELTIQLDSSEPREIAVSYLVAMPTWKPAYRLVLKDDDKATLQGWAVVSNVTGADWDGISFSLVSGQPMSFTYDLYTPQFLKRPDLSGLANQKAAAPEVVASGYAKESAPDKMYLRHMGAPQSPFMGGPMGMGMPGAQMEVTRELSDDCCVECETDGTIADDEMIDSFASVAEKNQIGSFDEYRLASKLHLPDGSTALVNLIQDEIFAKDTRLIKADTSPLDRLGTSWRQTKSLQTIQMKNDTGVALDAGPITLYRNSAVIGEGYLSRTEKDAVAYITYANEGRLTATIADKNCICHNRLDTVVGGCFEYTLISTSTLLFKFESHIDHEITALLQVARNRDWEPVDFPKDVIVSENKTIIPVTVAPNAVQTLSLTIRKTEARCCQYHGEASIHSGVIEAIKVALNEHKIPEQDEDAFLRFIADLDNHAQIKMKSLSLQQRKTEIDNDQRALTKNLAGLKDMNTDEAEDLRNQLIKRQQSNEQALVEITRELYALQSKKEEIELRLMETGKSLKYMRPLDADNG